MQPIRKVPVKVGYILAVLAGAPPAFFLVFNAVFADGGSILERLLSFGLVVAAYGILGLVFGFVWPRASWRWGIWISIPALIILGWYSSRETERLLLHFLYLVATVAPACLAAFAGTWFSTSR